MVMLEHRTSSQLVWWPINMYELQLISASMPYDQTQASVCCNIVCIHMSVLEQGSLTLGPSAWRMKPNYTHAAGHCRVLGGHGFTSELLNLPV